MVNPGMQQLNTIQELGPCQWLEEDSRVNGSCLPEYTEQPQDANISVMFKNWDKQRNDEQLFILGWHYLYLS
jgi:hypothetical protein